MTKVEKKEEEKIISENPHLRMYLEEIRSKMERPAFYSKLPRDLKEEKYPNLIYPTKGVVFIHIFRTKDMEGKEYHAIEIAIWLSMMTLVFVLTGCAAKAKISETPTPLATVMDQGPSVAQLQNGQQGFVISENAKMDGESRSEFERAVSMKKDGKNDKAIELLTKVIERQPGVTAPYINIAVAYMRTNKPDQAQQNLKTALGLVPAHPVASNEYWVTSQEGRTI